MIYWGWLASTTAASGLIELVDGVDPLVVTTWVVLMLSLFGPVGFYVRSEMKRLGGDGSGTAASPVP